MLAQMAQTAMTLIVAASTSPGEFALWAVAAIVVNAQHIIGTLGLGPALIYEDLGERIRDAVDTAFVATTALAVAMGLAVAASASPLGRLFATGFDGDEVASVVLVMSCVLAFTTASNIPQALLERALQFRQRALADIAGSGIYIGSTLTLLATGAGVWSLIVAKFVQSAALLAGYWLAAPVKPRARPQFDRVIFRRLFHYGKYVTLAGLVNFLVANLDNLALGTVSATALGAYALAYSVTNIVPTFLTQTVSKVAFPAYARLRSNDAALRHEFAVTFQVIAIVVLPATAALMLFAPDALVAVFGDEWRPARSIVVVLALYGFLRSISAACTTVMSARGAVRAMTGAQIAALLVSVAVLWPLLDYGGVGVAWAFTIGQLASTAYCLWMTRALWGAELASRTRWPLVAATIAAAAGLVAQPVADTNALVAGLIFTFTYAAVLMTADGRARDALGLRS